MNAVIGALAAAEACTLLLASLLHLGIAVPALSGLGEPRMPQAGIPEGVIGVVVAAGAAAALARGRWAFPVLVATQAFGVAGVLVGMAALAGGPAARTDANEVYHRVLLAALLVTLALSLTPPVRAVLRRA